MHMKKNIFLITIITLIVYPVIYLTGQSASAYHYKTMLIKGNTARYPPAEAKVLGTIGNSFVNRNGLLSDRLEGGKSHGYALLESMGQIMEYSEEVGNEALFAAAWQITEKYFRSPNGYFYWRVKEDGLVIDDATALVDELRLIKALANAGKQFESPNYTSEAESLTKVVNKYSVYDNYLSDVYESSSNIAAKSISLFYIDPQALQKMTELDPTVEVTANNTLKILSDAPINECGFFPDTYDYQTSSYQYKQEINMVEMLYTARNVYETAGDITPFLNFLKKELVKGHIYNVYSQDGAPSGDSESTAVYALASRLFINTGDKKNAFNCYRKMLSFQIREQGHVLNGAFGDSDSTTAYAFDQMEALLTLHAADEVFPKGTFKG